MPSYKLTYFDVRARAELSRTVFYAAGRDFEDNRMKREDWPSIKPTTNFGQVPILEVDGKALAQSNAIARFLARDFNLAGANSWEQALVDQYVELTEDMFKEAVKLFFEKDEEKKKDLAKNFSDVVLPKFMELFEKALDQNGGEYLVGSGLTLADLAVQNAFDTSISQNPACMDKFPKLKALRARVEAVPKLGEYLKNRKPSEI